MDEENEIYEGKKKNISWISVRQLFVIQYRIFLPC